MSDLTTSRNPAKPITLAVRIDARRAQLLWHNASPTATMDFEDRFESLDGDGGMYFTMPAPGPMAW